MLMADLAEIDPNCVGTMAPVSISAVFNQQVVRCSSLLLGIDSSDIGHYDLGNVRSMLGLRITKQVACFQSAGKCLQAWEVLKSWDRRRGCALYDIAKTLLVSLSNPVGDCWLANLMRCGIS